MAVAERGGNDIYVMDEKGAKGEISTNYPIEKIAVAENGIVSTILNNENSPMVVCYDATGNVLVDTELHLPEPDTRLESHFRRTERDFRFHICV